MSKIVQTTANAHVHSSTPLLLNYGSQLIS